MSSRSAVVPVVAGLFLIFLASMSGHLSSIDGLLYFRGAERFAFEQSLIFDPPVIWGAPNSVSIMPIGFSLVQIPAVVVAAWFGPTRPGPSTSLYDPALLYGDAAYTLAAWVNPLLVALTAGLAMVVAIRLGAPQRAAILVAIAIVLGSPLFFYGRSDFAQPLTTVLLVGIVALLIESVRRQNVQLGLMAGAIALSILTRPVDGLLVVFATAVVLCLPIGDWRPLRDGRRIGAEVAIGVVAGVSITLAVNVIRFGSPLDFGFKTDPTGSLGIGLIAETLSPGRGLVWHFPLVVLAPFGAWALWRRGMRHETAAIVVFVLVYLPVYATWQSLGQWSWGPRYLVPLIPLLGLLAGGLVWSGRRQASVVVLFGALAVAGGVANLAHLAVDQLPFWGTYGTTDFGTPGYWRQFELGAFAPIGSWQLYDPVAGPDVMWLRLAGSTGGASVVVGLVLLLVGVAVLVRAWRVSSQPLVSANR